jgi:hypothetical protein
MKNEATAAEIKAIKADKETTVKGEKLVKK